MDPIVNALFVSRLIACNESPSLPLVVRPPEKGFAFYITSHHSSSDFIVPRHYPQLGSLLLIYRQQ
jgi:hypothetical protein